MGIHMRVLSKSCPMNTKMPRFRGVSNDFAHRTNVCLRIGRVESVKDN